MPVYEKALEVIRDTFESLQRSGIIGSESSFSEDLVILGNNSELDSLGFVTFISDLEDKISVKEDREIYLVLDDISDFNLNNPTLTVKALTSYVAGLLNSEG